MAKKDIVKFRVRIYDRGRLTDEDFFNNKYDLWLGLFSMGNQYEQGCYDVEVSKLDTSRLTGWKPLAEF